jgi:hypothetical protein
MKSNMEKWLSISVVFLLCLIIISIINLVVDYIMLEIYEIKFKIIIELK